MFHLFLIKLFILMFFTKLNLSYPSQNPPSTESIEPNRDSNFNTDGAITYLGDEKIININNPDQNDMIQIKEMNVNLTAIRIQQEQLKSKYLNTLQVPNNLQHQPMFNNYDEIDLNESRSIEFNNRRQFEELAREQIRQVLETNLIRNADNINAQRRLPDDIHHYTAVYPQCNPPKTINSTTFFNSGNTWNLYFSPPASDNPLNAILRLYKLPSIDYIDGQSVNCSQGEDLIRITVSYYVKRREKRKRMCSSQMVSRHYTGWIVLDVKSAIKYWNKPTPNQTKKNYGIAIDIQDQDEQALPAVNFFHGYTCEANTSPAIPWNIYQEQGTDNMDSTVPKSPRIDYEIHQRGHTILPHNPSSISPPNNLNSHFYMNQAGPQDFSTMSDELDVDSESGDNSDSNLNLKNRRKFNANHRHHHRHRSHHQSSQQPNYYTTQNSQILKYYHRK